MRGSEFCQRKQLCPGYRPMGLSRNSAYLKINNGQKQCELSEFSIGSWAWPRHSSAANRVPGSCVGRFCALVWPVHKATRPVMIFSRHLYDQQGRFAKRWNENSSDTEADAHGAEAGTGYIQCETERPQCVQQTSMISACVM